MPEASLNDQSNMQSYPLGNSGKYYLVFMYSRNYLS